LLGDPPAIFSRCARSAWRVHAGADATTELARCQDLLRGVMGAAANSWKVTQTVSSDMLAALGQATDQADAAAMNARAAAVRSAAAVPWGECMRGATLERADGEVAAAAPIDAAELHGKTVGLYFTASWCGPCRRFTPELVQTYKEANGGMEVVLVPWDATPAERAEYARQSGMRWLAVPHGAPGASHSLADELTLRYDVRSIPTLVVLEVSPDGREARVLSRDGRADVERGRRSLLSARTPWLERALHSGKQASERAG